jgi:hypothetical protein
MGSSWAPAWRHRYAAGNVKRRRSRLENALAVNRVETMVSVVNEAVALSHVKCESNAKIS